MKKEKKKKQNKEIEEIEEKNYHIIVGTPGRVIDMIERGHLKVDQFRL